MRDAGKMTCLSCVCRIAALGVFLVTVVVPSLRAATLAETRGLGARAIAMGGAFTAVADDVSALYYNPAGLAQIRGHHGHLEYLFVKPRIYLKEGDTPSRVVLDKWTKAPMLGVVIDLSRAIHLSRQIVVGWNAYFPDNFKAVYKVRYGSQFDPFYPLYGDNHEDQTICLWSDAAIEVFPWLLIGGGTTLQIHGQYAALEVAVDSRGRSVPEQSRTTMDVTTEIYPLVGVLLKPWSRLRVGCVWRKDLKFTVAGGMQMQMKLARPGRDPVPIPLPITVAAQAHYRPQQVAVGISYLLDEHLLAACDLAYYDWRPYRDDAGRPLAVPMKEIVVPRFGIEYTGIRGIALRAGYSFQPSPLSQQPLGYHTNLIDNDVHSISIGTGYRWDLFGLLPQAAEWSCFYQLQIMPSRTFENVHIGNSRLKSSGMFHSFGFGIHFFM